MNPRRRAKVCAFALGAAVALVLGEILCRVAGIGTPGFVRLQEDRTVRGEAWAYVPGNSLVFSYPDNPRRYFDANNSVVGRINAQGFRGLDVDREKRAGSVRYVFLGDSFTLGYGVRDEHTLPASVERALRAGGSDAEVLNFGVNGFDTPDEVALLRDYAASFEPDVVVTVLFLNDAGATGTLEFLRRERYLARVRPYSRFVNAAVGLVEAALVERDILREYEASFREDSVGFRNLRDSLAEAQRLALREGFQLVLVVYPILYRLDERYPFRGIHEKIEAFCGTEGIDYVDLLPAFLGRRDRDLWVHPADQHPNEIATELAAVYLVDQLRAKAIPSRGQSLQ